MKECKIMLVDIVWINQEVKQTKLKNEATQKKKRKNGKNLHKTENVSMLKFSGIGCFMWMAVDAERRSEWNMQCQQKPKKSDKRTRACSITMVKYLCECEVQNYTVALVSFQCSILKLSCELRRFVHLLQAFRAISQFFTKCPKWTKTIQSMHAVMNTF